MIDGRSLEQKIREILNESSDSTFINIATSYGYAYDAVIEFIRRTFCLTGSQTITTIAGVRTYNLDPNYLALYMTDDEMRKFIIYNNGTSNTTIPWRDFAATIYEQNIYSGVSTTAPIPDTFSIIDATPLSLITGSATSTTTLANGESTLTNSSAPFANVSAGDRITNIDDDSDGYVAAVTDTSNLVTAMLDGTNNFWTSGNDYAIMPQQRYAVYFDPAPAISGNIVTVYFLKKPPIVFSPFRSYPMQSLFTLAIAEYACFLYKFRDSNPNFGNAWYTHFDKVCRENQAIVNRGMERGGYRVSLKRRLSHTYGSHR